MQLSSLNPFPRKTSPDVRSSLLKQIGLGLLCLAWIAIGLTGHAPWKTEDAKTAVVAWEMVQDHDWLVPQLVAQPNFDVGLLVPQLAAMTISLFSPALAPHDAARLAAGVLLFITLLFTALTARLFSDNTPESRLRFWMPMFVLIGTVGLFDRGHMLSPQLGGMAAVAVGAFSLALMLRRPGTGGAILGVSAAFGAMAYNLSLLWVVLLTAALLPVVHPAWRTRVYGLALGVAAVIAASLCAALPLLLYLRAPALLDQWWAVQKIAPDLPHLMQNIFWLLKNIWWLAFPAWLLIIWLFRIRSRGFNGGWRTPSVALFSLMSVLLLVHFVLTPGVRVIDSLLFLVPLALLAAEEIDTLPRGGSAGLDWFGILSFGLAAVALWYFWWDVYLHGMGSYAAQLFRDAEAGFQPSFRLRSALVSLFLTVLWVMLVRPARQSSRRAVLNWAAGMMLVSGMVSTIWMPYLDSRRSYEVVANMLKPYVKQGCITVRNDVGDAQRAIFYYYAGAVTRFAGTPEAAPCKLLLTQFDPTATEKTPPDVLGGYTLLVWSHRYGDDDEYYALYQREAAPPAPPVRGRRQS